MDDEKLIECVRKYSFLYDLAHPKYMDTKYKAKTWKEIGEELKQPDSVCKARWQNIRDQFRKYQSKRVTKSGQAAEKCRKYKYEEILRFLIPHFAERETISNIQPLPGNSGNQEQAIDVTKITGVDDEQVEEPFELDESKNTSTRGMSIHQNKRQSRLRTNISYPKETAASKVMEFLLQKERMQSEKSINIHSIDAFLSGIAPTLKQLSPYNQHIAKGRIFAIVQELEFQQLESGNASQSYTPILSWSQSTSSRQNECSVDSQICVTPVTQISEFSTEDIQFSSNSFPQ